MRICSHCGSEIGIGDVFCGNCGTGQAPWGNHASVERGSRAAAADGFGDPPAAAAGATLQVAAERAGADAVPRQPAPGAGTAAAPVEPPGGANGIRQPDVASPPNGLLALGTASTPGAASARAGETLEQKYMRQTRNATVFIAVIVGIVTVIALVGVIWTATTISNLNSQLNGTSGLFGSNCQSQGGTNPNC